MKALIVSAALGIAGLLTTPITTVAQTTGTAQPAASTETADVATLLKNVSDTAQRLQATVGDLDSRIEASKNSAENGNALLNDMLASARDLESSLGKDSPVWLELSTLFDEWGKKRDHARKQSETKPQFTEIAELWQSKLTEALKLREQILKQAAESQALVDAIEAQREIVLAYYEVQAADKVLESMRAMSDDLAEMNESMRAIVDQTGVVAGENVAQQ